MKLLIPILASLTLASNHWDSITCPTGGGGLQPSFDYTFGQATVIHKNLNGKYCELNSPPYDPVDACDDVDSDGNPIEEILYCNMDANGEFNGLLCLQIVDISEDTDINGDRLYPDAVAYACDEDKLQKCGNVLEAGNEYGQIQIDLPDAPEGVDHSMTRLRFQTMDCTGSTHDSTVGPFPTYVGCTPIEWDVMTMTFLDIDGGGKYEEKMVLYDAVHFDVALEFENGTQFDVQDHCFPDNPDASGGFRCDIDDNGNVIDYDSDRRCFPNLQLFVWDPEGTYIQKDCDGNRLVNGTGINTGDVTLFNFRQREVTDGEPNQGDSPNPEDKSIDELTDRQRARSITGYWAASEYLNNRIAALTAQSVISPQPTPAPATRSSFEVSMGVLKRTIMFTGRSESISGEVCELCGQKINSGACETLFGHANYQFYPNRVCNYVSGGVVNQCDASFCCSETPTSHGDPIIWTFDEECYDLNKDGLWLATSHPEFNHKVNIAVYNDYMREIQVVFGEEVVLSINNLGEVMNNDYPFAFEEVTVPCPESMKDCIDEYKEFRFDAQDFSFTVHMLRHDYLDAALKEGEFGYHLDIYPRPYKSFAAKQANYNGLYFENPLPEELKYCTGGSPRQ